MHSSGADESHQKEVRLELQRSGELRSRRKQTKGNRGEGIFQEGKNQAAAIAGEVLSHFSSDGVSRVSINEVARLGSK